MTFTVSAEIRFELMECCVCGTTFGLSETFNLALRNEKQRWYCPNGHSQSYTAQPIREKLAESERENLRLREEHDQIQAAAARKSKQITSLKKRIKNQSEKGEKAT